MSLEPSTSGKALLLTTNTEVSIAPKLHARQNGSVSTTTNGKAKKKRARGANSVGDGTATPLTEASSSASAEESAKLSNRVLRVLPQGLVPNVSRYSTSSETGTVPAYVSRATLAAQDGETGSTSNPRPWRARIRRLPPPADPSQEQASGALASSPAPRVLVPNGDISKNPSSQKPAEKVSDGVILVWSPEVVVPEGHIVLSGQTEDVEDWDMVRCVPPR